MMSSISTKSQEACEVLHCVVSSISTKNWEACELHHVVSSISTKNREVHDVLHHVVSSISTKMKNQEVHVVLHHVVSSISTKNQEVQVVLHHMVSSMSKNPGVHEVPQLHHVVSSISTKNWEVPKVLQLHHMRLVGRRELLRDHPCKLCVQAVILAVVAQLRRELEEPGHDSRCRLRVLDVTGVPDDPAGRAPDGMSVWSGTVALAKACVEVSKHQREFQRRGSKRHKGRSGAATASAAPQPPGVDVHADLFVNGTSYGILRDALQTAAAGPLRLKCRLTGLSVILPHLSRFPELRSLKLQYSNVDVRRPTPESAIGIRCLAGQLGMLPSLRELNLGSSRLSGNLRQILCDLQAPLESLELAFCSLVPADLAFLSQSFHAPALKRLDLSGHDFSQGLLEPLRLLLEETSASLLHLDLMECRMADSHLDALLPTLRRCSRLRFLGLYGNSLSTAALKDLLQKTLELPDLHLVVYPFPVDCYKPEPPRRVPGSRRIYEEPMDGQLLAAATAEISQLLKNSGRTDLIWTYNPYGHGALDYFSL
ncbi:hypothetical protein HGM15179_016875 [Zosterops borbonicus]|uniref:Leucine-rich repeat-containing protein 14 n=2 Tax=Zosterops TaxID=36298 RepID=A0A8K1LDW9_9PASS|nr:hypothetical protein HGM15179_016875 [Zosterops borbonicus]